MTVKPDMPEKSRSREANGQSSKIAVAAIHASASRSAQPSALRSLRNRAQMFTSSGPDQMTSYWSRWRANSFVRRRPQPLENAPYQSSSSVWNETNTRCP